MTLQAATRMEALVTDLRNSIESLHDDMFLAQLRLGATILANAVREAKPALNAGRVNDIEFAFSDLVQMVDGLGAADSERLRGPLQLIEQQLQTLKQATSLAPELVGRVRDLQKKLRERCTAIERQPYRPQGSAPEPLPHDPHHLRGEAELLRNDLAAAGFVSTSLDQMISDPGSMHLHHLSAIIDELDVMIGTS